MTVYDLFFADGSKERLTMTFWGTEEFRLSQGGKSNVDLVLEQARSNWPNRRVVRIVRTMTGVVVWEKE